VPSDVVDDSRVVEDVHISFKCVDEDFSTLTVDEVHVSSEGTSDVVDTLVEFSTPIPDVIYVHEDGSSDFEHALVESSVPIQVLGIQFSYL